MSWKIIPHVSVGPLRFGMTIDEVAALMGPPSHVQEDAIPHGGSEELKSKYEDHRFEFRLAQPASQTKPTIEYQNGRVVSFEIYQELPGVEIGGYAIFDKELKFAIEALKKMSSEYGYNDDSYVFLDLGVSLSNDDVWEYVPSINVFAKGHFDDFVNEAGFELVRK